MRNHRSGSRYERRDWTDSIRQEVVIRYLSGESFKVIAKDMGLSYDTMLQAKHRKWFGDLRSQLLEAGISACGFDYKL